MTTSAAAGIVFCLASVQGIPEPESAPSEATFRARFDEASRAYRRLLSDIQGTGRYLSTEDGETLDVPVSFSLGDGRKKVVFNNKNVYSTSEGASFFVRREQPGSSYQINNHGDPRYINATIRKHLERFLLSPIAIDGVPLAEIMKQDRFRIRSVTRDRADDPTPKNRDLVRIEFDYVSKADMLGPGFVLVSPKFHWMMTHYECQLDNYQKYPNFKLSCDIEYGDAIDGVPLPRKVTLTRVVAKESKDVMEFDQIAKGSAPVEEFTLAHYGLPDLSVPGSDHTVSRAAYWFFGMGVVSLILGLATKYWSNRWAYGD